MDIYKIKVTSRDVDSMLMPSKRSLRNARRRERYARRKTIAAQQAKWERICELRLESGQLGYKPEPTSFGEAVWRVD